MGVPNATDFKYSECKRQGFLHHSNSHWYRQWWYCDNYNARFQVNHSWKAIKTRESQNILVYCLQCWESSLENWHCLNMCISWGEKRQITCIMHCEQEQPQKRNRDQMETKQQCLNIMMKLPKCIENLSFDKIGCKPWQIISYKNHVTVEVEWIIFLVIQLNNKQVWFCYKFEQPVCDECYIFTIKQTNYSCACCTPIPFVEIEPATPPIFSSNELYREAVLELDKWLRIQMMSQYWRSLFLLWTFHDFFCKSLFLLHLWWRRGMKHS